MENVVQFLQRKQFYQTLVTATEPSEISLYFSRDISWDWHWTMRDAAKAVNQAIELVSTVEEGYDLWRACVNVGSTPRQNNRLLNKIVDLIKTEDELYKVYSIFGCEEREIERRRVIRRLFDKADTLRIKTL